MNKLLVICMGNICRSPMAQVVLQSFAQRTGVGGQFKIDSAGTHASHFGEKPDPRAQAALLRRGYEIGKIRSRRVNAQDFLTFDAIFAMDSSNLLELQRICPANQIQKLHLFLNFGVEPTPTAPAIDVPDPYYGSPAGFEHVLDLCELGATQILAKLAAQARTG